MDAQKPATFSDGLLSIFDGLSAADDPSIPTLSASRRMGAAIDAVSCDVWPKDQPSKIDDSTSDFTSNSEGKSEAITKPL